MLPFARMLEYGNIRVHGNIKKIIVTNGNTVLVLYQDGRVYGRGTHDVTLGGASSPNAWVLVKQNIVNIYGCYGDVGALLIDDSGNWWWSGKRSIYTGNTNAPVYETTYNNIKYNFGTLDLSTVQDVAFTSYGIIFLMTNGNSYVCGYSYYSEIGSSTSPNTPRLMYSGVTKIYACSNIAMWLQGTTLIRGGYNGVGQIGNGSTGQGTAPASLSGFTVKDMCTTGSNTYILGTNNILYGTGSGNIMIGTGGRTTFGAVAGNISSIKANGNLASNMFGTYTSTGLYSAGNNINYTLGDGTITQQNSLQVRGIGLNVTDISTIQVAPCGSAGTFVVSDNVLYFAGDLSPAAGTFGYNSTTFMVVTDLPS